MPEAKVGLGAGQQGIESYQRQLQKSPADFWGEYAKIYDTLLHLDAYRQMITGVSEAIQAKTGQTITDVGCGTGNVLNSIAKETKNITIHGIDRSKQMLAAANAKMRDGGGQNASWHLADLEEGFEDLEIPACDRIIATNSLYAIKRRAAVLKLMAERLKRSGKIVVVNPLQNAKIGLILKTQEGAEQLSNMDWDTNDPATLNNMVNRLFSPNIATQFRQLNAMNGAIVLETRAKSEAIVFPSPEEMRDSISDAGLKIADERLTYGNVHLQITAVHKKRQAKKPKETPTLQTPTLVRMASKEELRVLRPRILREYQNELNQPDRTFEMDPSDLLLFINQNTGDVMACMGIHRPNSKTNYYPTAGHFGLEAMEEAVPGLDLKSGNNPELMRLATFEPCKRTGYLSALAMLCSFKVAYDQGATHTIGTNKERLLNYQKELGLPILSPELPAIPRGDMDPSKLWDNYWTDDENGKVVPAILPLTPDCMATVDRQLKVLDPNGYLTLEWVE